MARERATLDRFTFGGRLPWAVGLVLAVTVVASFVAAVGSRHVAPLFELAMLRPADVWRGEVWRLITWTFVEPAPFALLFQCLFLYWFGRDLGDEWGSRRFLRVYGAVVLAAAIGTCLVAQVDRAVLDHAYIGSWPVACAMTVAWGLWFPDRVIRIWFILPIRGYVLAWLTVGITGVYALYHGWERHLPTLFAEGAVLAWLFRGSVLARWSRARRGWAERGRETRRQDRAVKRAKSIAHLRLIENHDDDPPPLPPELEGKIDELLRGSKKPPS